MKKGREIEDVRKQQIGKRREEKRDEGRTGENKIMATYEAGLKISKRKEKYSESKKEEER